MSEKMLLQPEDYEFKIEKEKGQEILDNKNKVCYLDKVVLACSKLPIVGIAAIRIIDKFSPQMQVNIVDNVSSNFSIEKIVDALPESAKFDYRKSKQFVDNILRKLMSEYNYVGHRYLTPFILKINDEIGLDIVKDITEKINASKIIKWHQEIVNKFDNESKNYLVEKLFTELENSKDLIREEEIIDGLKTVNFKNLDFNSLRKLVNPMEKIKKYDFQKTSILKIYYSLLAHPQYFDKKYHEEMIEDLLMADEHEFGSIRKKTIDNIGQYTDISPQKVVESVYARQRFLDNTNKILSQLKRSSLFQGLSEAQVEEIADRGKLYGLLGDYENSDMVDLLKSVNQRKQNDNEFAKYIESDEFQKIVEQKFVDNLQKGRFVESSHILHNLLGDNQDILQKPEIINAAKLGVEKLTFVNYLGYLFYEKIFGTKPEMMQEMTNVSKKTLIFVLQNGDIEEAEKIVKKYLQNNSEFFSSPELVEAARQGLYTVLNGNYIDSGLQLADEFLKDKPEIVAKVAMAVFADKLEHEKFDHAIKIYNNFLINQQDFISNTIEKIAVNNLEHGKFNYVINLNNFLPENLTVFLKTPILTGAAKKGMENCLKRGEMDFKEIIDFYNISNDYLKKVCLFQLTEDLENKKFVEASKIIGEFSSKFNLLTELPIEKQKEYIIIEKITNSPSQEMQKLRDYILENLRDSIDIEKKYNEVEDVFVKNNLPLVGKIYKVFKILYPDNRFESKMKQQSVSPVLYECNNKERNGIIYSDLLNIHINSNNRSLKEFLKVITDLEQILNQLTEKNIDQLSEIEKRKLKIFFDKLDVLYMNSVLGENNHKATNYLTLSERYESLKKQFYISEKNTFKKRITQLFLKPSGFSKIEEILHQMNEVREIADKRGRNIFINSENKSIFLQKGDLVKGVNEQYIETILQNGSVAKEYLGAFTPGSDETPFDTDLAMIQEDNIDIEKTMAISYGDIYFVIKDRNQMQITRQNDMMNKSALYQKNKYELFQQSGEHYGIRTGFPTVEIDYLIINNSIAQNNKQLENIYYNIAQNGWYIPVVQQDGKIIFTPQMYDQYRKIFNGIEKYDGNKIEVSLLNNSQKDQLNLAEEVDNIKNDNERIKQCGEKVIRIINEILRENNIELKDEFDPTILGARLFNIGSTGRDTQIPGDEIDFDFTLQLENKDFNSASKIAKEIIYKLQPKTDDSHIEDNGYYQLRATRVDNLDKKSIDIDIGFAKKSDIIKYGSNDAIKDKLLSIKKEYGENTYLDVLANITLCKKILKKNNIYKKLDGGIGGIGVENWILSNQGNLFNAFSSYFEAAYDDKGNELSLSNFKRKYKILDAGTNLKFDNHDNFVLKLNESSHRKMLDMIRPYLGK